MASLQFFFFIFKVTVWQNGRMDSQPATSCDQYSSVNFATVDYFYKDVDSGTYALGTPSPAPTKAACQFAGENLALGKNTHASAIHSASYPSEEVRIQKYLAVLHVFCSKDSFNWFVGLGSNCYHSFLGCRWNLGPS